MSIVSSTFNIKPLNESAYELTIRSSDEATNQYDTTFIFVQSPSVQPGTIVDVFTKNGKCSSAPIETIFSNRDVQEIKKAAKKTGAPTPSGAVVAVLDLQDPCAGYLPSDKCVETIANCEQVVCDFFKNDKGTALSGSAKKVRSLLKTTLPLDFVICEGSLKKHLLQYGGFSAKEIEYFHTRSGALSFCQCAEFFMNGFKLGQRAYNAGHTTEFLADEYIEPISANAVFQPFSKSTVFYPALYKEVYSPAGPFAQTLKTIFAVSGDFDSSTKITTLNMERKA